MPATTAPTETAVIVSVPAAEPAVAQLRRRLDVAASWGVPAHVSVLYPFVRPANLDEAVLSRLGSALRSVPAFECRFARSAWFGDEVLWLAPEPAEAFRDLFSAVWRAFPQHPPYGGLFDDVVPHLTVGERGAGTLAELRAAETAVGRKLPFTARIEHALLIAGSREPDSWRTVCELPLGQQRASQAQ